MKAIEPKIYTGIKDDKARRRVNVSNKVANITADQIEAGISIEALESINVPVFAYGTQVTIHGKLPDLGNERVCGYKSLFQNGNGSIGVKYLAIDGAKKQTILSCTSLTRCRLHVETDSTGMFMQKRIATDCKPESIATGRAFLAEIPGCFIGGKQLVKDAYGCLFVSVSFNAIYEKDLFRFIDWLTIGEIKTEGDFQRLKQARDDKRAAEKAEFEAKQNQQRAELAEKAALAVIEWKKDGFDIYEGPKKDGLYLVRPYTFSDGKAFKHSLYKKHGTRFKEGSCFSDSKERPVELEFKDWKNPSKYYSEKCKGFIKL